MTTRAEVPGTCEAVPPHKWDVEWGDIVIEDRGCKIVKAERYSRTLIRIGRFEPTSQVCSACGVQDGPKPLHVRAWTCGACGTVLDRDVNAALNVAKAAGLAASACGARVRPGVVPARRGEAGTRSKLTPAGVWQGRIPALQGGEEVNGSVPA